MEYYAKQKTSFQQTEWTEFQRWTRAGSDVAIYPWYNKEIFIKLYQATEGRDLDNSHPYPYIAIQVRWDRDRNQRYPIAGTKLLEILALVNTLTKFQRII